MKVVFHHTEAELHSQVIRNIENLLDDETIDIEAVALVANSGGLGLLTENSDH